MFGLSAAVRVYLATHPADMRRSFDGLSALVSGLALDPLSGHLLMSPSLAPSLGTRILAHLLVLPGLCSERRRQLGGGHLAAM
jgi:hypothetical protein